MEDTHPDTPLRGRRVLACSDYDATGAQAEDIWTRLDKRLKVIGTHGTWATVVTIPPNKMDDPTCVPYNINLCEFTHSHHDFKLESRGGHPVKRCADCGAVLLGRNRIAPPVGKQVEKTHECLVDVLCAFCHKTRACFYCSCPNTHLTSCGGAWGVWCDACGVRGPVSKSMMSAIMDWNRMVLKVESMAVTVDEMRHRLYGADDIPV